MYNYKALCLLVVSMFAMQVQALYKKNKNAQNYPNVQIKNKATESIFYSIGDKYKNPITMNLLELKPGGTINMTVDMEKNPKIILTGKAYDVLKAAKMIKDSKDTVNQVDFSKLFVNPNTITTKVLEYTFKRITPETTLYLKVIDDVHANGPALQLVPQKGVYSTSLRKVTEGGLPLAHNIEESNISSELYYRKPVQ